MYTVAALMAFHVTLCKCPALHVFKQEACRIYLVTDTVVFLSCDQGLWPLHTCLCCLPRWCMLCLQHFLWKWSTPCVQYIVLKYIGLNYHNH